MPGNRDRGGFERIRESVQGHPMWNLFRYCMVYWPRLGAGVLSAVVYRITRLIPPLIVAAAIDRAIDTPGPPGLLADLGLLTSQVVPTADTALRFSVLESLVLLAVGAFLLRAVARFFARYLIQSTAQKVQRDLRDDTYRHMQTLSMSFFDNHETGGMMSILNNDINRLEEFLNSELTQVIRVITIVLGIGGVLFYFYPSMAVVALLPVPVIALASGSFLVWIDKKYRRIRETVGRLSSRLANNLGGIRVIKTFNRYDFEGERVAEHSREYHDQHVAALKIRRAYFAALRLTTGISFTLILYFGGYDVINGAITLGTFTLFFLFLRRLYGPMRRIGRTANKYQLAKSGAERVFGLLGLEPEITSAPDARRAVDLEGRVEFDDVHFAYGDDEVVLDGVSLDIPAARTVGLVGPTGAGKSTLLKLIPRFYDVDSGQVRVDGVDVREYELTSLRENIGIVDQDPYLFSGSALENIAYGDQALLQRIHEFRSGGTEVGDTVYERVREAAKVAEADEFIRRLPEGYETRIGERGVKLSGGQRQRLSIARAVLNDPAIIIFDEATSDVDTNTEVLIQKSLNRLCEDRTAFLIAHRLSTLQEADRIIVLSEGQVVESGQHGELLARGGLYSELWHAQTEEEKIQLGS